MQSEGRQAHWETVYTEKGEDQVSWFQETPTPSLDLIAKVGATRASAIIDIGGGASRLVDNLVKRGFGNVTVLDLSEAALALKAGGYAIIATFALDGPERCSGLQVARYDPVSLGKTLGRAFELVDTRQHTHATPWDTEQSFQFSVFRRCF